MVVDVVFLFMCLFIPKTLCKSHCVGTCYSGRLFPEAQDIFHGKHLKGYSYKNITTDDPAKCYSSCVQDCRCKACQMKDERCELLDEDKASKADSFTAEPGYVYFDLKQTMYHGSSHMVPPGVQCYNGCCRSHPCMNGGTCVETCKSPKEKFTCTCPQRFIGKVCEVKVASCMDVVRSSKRLPKNGVYTITRSDLSTVIPVYCAFNKPNQAWTLIESFSLKNRQRFQSVPFYVNGKATNSDIPPNWTAFRSGIARMKYFRSKSTLFRATCDFPNRVSLTPDLLIGRLSDVDIMNEKDILGCRRYKFVDIRGYNCTNCTVLTGYGKSHSWHFHLDVTWNVCDFRPPCKTKDVDSFGNYAVFEEQSKCTATPQSTTQWWFGEEK